MKIALPTKVEPNIQDAVTELVKEGSKVEYGILDIVANKNIGIYNMLDIPASEVHGDQLWVRKNGIMLGGDRSDVFGNNFFADNLADNIKIDMNKEFVIRYSLDMNAVNSVGTNYVGTDIKTQLVARLFEGIQKGIKAKLDAVMINVIKEVPDISTTPYDKSVAGAVSISTDSWKKSKDLINDLLNTYIKLNFAITERESLISSYTLGSNDENYVAYTSPIVANLTNEYLLRFGGNSESANAIKTNSVGKLFNVQFFKHPFFNQIANKKPVSIATIDRTKTIFDISNDYDFTGFAGMIIHKESALLPIKFNALSVLPDPNTGNLSVVARIGYGFAAIRPQLMIKILDGKADEQTITDELQKTAAIIVDPTNAIIAADASELKAPLETYLKTLTDESIDWANAVVNSTDPINANTVTEATAFKAIVTIPIKSGVEADQRIINISAHYKNS